MVGDVMKHGHGILHLLVEAKMANRKLTVTRNIGITPDHVSGTFTIGERCFTLDMEDTGLEGFLRAVCKIDGILRDPSDDEMKFVIRTAFPERFAALAAKETNGRVNDRFECQLSDAEVLRLSNFK